MLSVPAAAALLVVVFAAFMQARNTVLAVEKSLPATMLADFFFF
jgi:hypothetical protein